MCACCCLAFSRVNHVNHSYDYRPNSLGPITIINYFSFFMKTYNYVQFHSHILSYFWLIGSILSTTLLVINKSDSSRSSDFVNHSYDQRPDWTPLGPINCQYLSLRKEKKGRANYTTTALTSIGLQQYFNFFSLKFDYLTHFQPTITNVLSIVFCVLACNLSIKF